MDAIAFGWMHIWEDRVGSGGRWRRLAPQAGAIAAVAVMLLAGCASPGPPLPPSLKLPEIATDLTARRVGDQVLLHWTTPTHTTDKLLIRGMVTAEICRAAGASVAQAPAATARRPEKAATSECPAVVVRQTVTPGASDAVDPLPESLTAGPARLLEYRVQLKNAAGRTAGPSPAAVAVAGAAPEMVEDLQATQAKQGVVLEWRRAAGSGETVELERTTVSVPGASAAASQRMDALPGAGKEPAESHFRAGEAAGGVDAGGTVDRTAEIGAAYRYTAQRVRSVAVSGQTLELRSAHLGRGDGGGAGRVSAGGADGAGGGAGVCLAKAMRRSRRSIFRGTRTRSRASPGTGCIGGMADPPASKDRSPGARRRRRVEAAGCAIWCGRLRIAMRPWWRGAATRTG